MAGSNGRPAGAFDPADHVARRLREQRVVVNVKDGAVRASMSFFNNEDDLERLVYFGLPASMVAAAILVALGVADRLREQRAALGDARPARVDDDVHAVAGGVRRGRHLDRTPRRADSRHLQEGQRCAQSHERSFDSRRCGLHRSGT
jgi:hypothetical protein